MHRSILLAAALIALGASAAHASSRHLSQSSPEHTGLSMEDDNRSLHRSAPVSPSPSHDFLFSSTKTKFSDGDTLYALASPEERIEQANRAHRAFVNAQNRPTRTANFAASLPSRMQPPTPPASPPAGRKGPRPRPVETPSAVQTRTFEAFLNSPNALTKKALAKMLPNGSRLRYAVPQGASPQHVNAVLSLVADTASLSNPSQAELANSKRLWKAFELDPYWAFNVWDWARKSKIALTKAGTLGRRQPGAILAQTELGNWVTRNGQAKPTQPFVISRTVLAGMYQAKHAERLASDLAAAPWVKPYISYADDTTVA